MCRILCLKKCSSSLLKYEENRCWKSLYLGGILCWTCSSWSGLHDSKVVILSRKAKNIPGSRKNLKMQNWRPYLKKIHTKHWKLIIQQFAVFKKPWELFQSMENRCHRNGSQDALSGDFWRFLRSIARTAEKK